MQERTTLLCCPSPIRRVAAPAVGSAAALTSAGSDREPFGAAALPHAGSLPVMQPVQGVGRGSGHQRVRPHVYPLLFDAKSRRRDISLGKRSVEEVPDGAAGGNFFFSFSLLFTSFYLSGVQFLQLNLYSPRD